MEISFLYQNKPAVQSWLKTFCPFFFCFLWCFFNTNAPRIWILFPSQQVNAIIPHFYLPEHPDQACYFSISHWGQKYKPLFFFCVLYIHTHTIYDMDIWCILCICPLSFYISVTCCMIFTRYCSINCAIRGHTWQYFFPRPERDLSKCLITSYCE